MIKAYEEKSHSVSPNAASNLSGRVSRAGLKAVKLKKKHVNPYSRSIGYL